MQKKTSRENDLILLNLLLNHPGDEKLLTNTVLRLIHKIVGKKSLSEDKKHSDTLHYLNVLNLSIKRGEFDCEGFVCFISEIFPAMSAIPKKKLINALNDIDGSIASFYDSLSSDPNIKSAITCLSNLMSSLNIKSVALDVMKIRLGSGEEKEINNIGRFHARNGDFTSLANLLNNGTSLTLEMSDLAKRLTAQNFDEAKEVLLNERLSLIDSPTENRIGGHTLLLQAIKQMNVENDNCGSRRANKGMNWDGVFFKSLLEKIVKTPSAHPERAAFKGAVLDVFQILKSLNRYNYLTLDDVITSTKLLLKAGFNPCNDLESYPSFSQRDPVFFAKIWPLIESEDLNKITNQGNQKPKPRI